MCSHADKGTALSKQISLKCVELNPAHLSCARTCELNVRIDFDLKDLSVALDSHTGKEGTDEKCNREWRWIIMSKSQYAPWHQWKGCNRTIAPYCDAASWEIPQKEVMPDNIEIGARRTRYEILVRTPRYKSSSVVVRTFWYECPGNNILVHISKGNLRRIWTPTEGWKRVIHHLFNPVLHNLIICLSPYPVSPFRLFPCPLPLTSDSFHAYMTPYFLATWPPHLSFAYFLILLSPISMHCICWFPFFPCFFSALFHVFFCPHFLALCFLFCLFACFILSFDSLILSFLIALLLISRLPFPLVPHLLVSFFPYIHLIDSWFFLPYALFLISLFLDCLLSYFLNFCSIICLFLVSWIFHSLIHTIPVPLFLYACTSISLY